MIGPITLAELKKIYLDNGALCGSCVNLLDRRTIVTMWDPGGGGDLLIKNSCDDNGKFYKEPKEMWVYVRCRGENVWGGECGYQTSHNRLAHYLMTKKRIDIDKKIEEYLEC